MSTKILCSPVIAALAALVTLGCGEAPDPRDPFEERAASGSLKIATWNMEWLNRNNGSGPVNRSNADYQKLAEYAAALDADIIAVQEVDGPQAAARVFDTSIYDVHMSSRSHAQRTGFVYRKDLDVTVYPDYTALNVGSLRHGTDIEVDLGGQTLRLLNVHLKSGCFSQSLSSGSNSCTKLAQQVDPLEDWIDARAAQGVPMMVLGDFNRRFFASGSDQFWSAIDDGNPAGADLSSPTQTGSAQCNNGQYPEFIDHLVTGSLATAAVVPGSFDQLLYSNADSNNYDLSDHCPLSIELDFGGDLPDPASCANSCGGQSPSGCWCDALCESFGNCCADKAAVCDAPPPPDPQSCEGHCGGQAPGGCWCDDQCVDFGNCCADKVAACGAPPPDPNSCVGECGGQAPGGCWCDSLCASYGDCCEGKQAACG